MGLAETSRPLRIANIIEEGRWGGPQKRITLVSAALKAHAVETVVLLPKKESEHFQQELDKEGVAWKTLSLHRLGRGWKTLVIYALTFFFDVFTIWRLLRRGSYDAIHVSGGAWQLKGAIAGRLSGTPVIWHLNDTQMPTVLVMLFNIMGRLADGFFVAANRVRRYYIDGTALAKTPVHLIPAPVVTANYSPEVAAGDDQIANFPAPRIVTIANVNPIKGLKTLIDAAALLKKGLVDFSVVVVGAQYSSQRVHFKQLQTMIKAASLDNNIHFVGARKNVASVLKSADTFVCASFAEASPMAVWEAMSMGCAIVSTDVGDVSEYIKSGENGFVVPVGDAQAMADAITRLAADAVLRKEFGLRAREVACRALDISVIAEKTACAYRAIIAVATH